MKKKKRLIIAAVVLVLVAALCIAGNEVITVSRSEYSSSSLPNSFDGFKILQISDLHNKLFGTGQKYLLSKIESERPDIIVITGDVIDSSKYNLENALALVRGAASIAPVYYASGNHELRKNRYDKIMAALADAGATLLENRSVALTRGGQSITLVGLTDVNYSSFDPEPACRALDSHLLPVSDGFTVLLAHRPGVADISGDFGCELAFSGHLHGGQWRIPFVGGLFSPDTGFFPGNTSGSHTSGTATVYVSRGLGNSVFPLRLFNPPELVSVTLRSR